MNDKYAVDPEAPANVREMKLLLDQFGLETGRFLARYPHDWPQNVLKRLGEASTLDRTRMLEIFRLRRGAMFSTESLPYISTTSWGNNASVVQERHGAFNKVIGSRDNGFGWLSLEQVLYEHEHALPVARGGHIPMKGSAYAICAGPLLASSVEVILVDPYFTLRDSAGMRCPRHWPVLLALIRAADSSRSCEIIRLILDRGKRFFSAGEENVLKTDLAEAVIEANASRVRVVCELRDSVGHGRYLLSIHGGLQFDRGFGEFSGRRVPTNHIHWLSKPELDPLLDLFGFRTVVKRAF